MTGAKTTVYFDSVVINILIFVNFNRSGSVMMASEFGDVHNSALTCSSSTIPLTVVGIDPTVQAHKKVSLKRSANLFLPTLSI